jgi:hypothetical protein
MMTKTKESLEHKKHEQNGKDVIIGLLQPKAPRKWPYTKWS